MIKRCKILAIVLIIVPCLFVFNSCSSDDGYRPAIVTIDIGLNRHYQSNRSLLYSIIDPFRLFVKNAIAAPPTNISSITLTVSGYDMDTIERSIPISTGILTLPVPSGIDRSFSVMASVNPEDAGIVKSWSGNTILDLPPGERVALTINMSIFETKLVIPDRSYPPNGRLIQIDNMEGDGWSELIAIDLRPYDVDIDSRGRIYVADDDNTDRRVIRMDNILRDNDISITCDPPVSGAMRAVAVDRGNNLVYFSDGGNLARSDLDGNNAEGLTISAGVEGIQTIRGMSVDDNGILFVAGSNATGSPRIYRYDPSQQSVTHIYSSNLNTPWDILINQDYLYVADRSGADGYKILQLSFDLSTLMGSYGDNASGIDTNPDTNKGQFYGPRRFVGILNKKIFIIDDGEGNNDWDKLIAMDDISGTDWNTFGSGGTGVNQFRFYYHC